MEKFLNKRNYWPIYVISLIITFYTLGKYRHCRSVCLGSYLYNVPPNLPILKVWVLKNEICPVSKNSTNFAFSLWNFMKLTTKSQYVAAILNKIVKVSLRHKGHWIGQLCCTANSAQFRLNRLYCLSALTLKISKEIFS